MSPSTCCFIRDSSKLTRFEHQIGIFSSLAVRHFVSQCQWTFCGRRVVCGGTESLASGAIQVSQLPMTRKIHGLHPSPHSTKERTALRSEDLYVEEYKETRFDRCLALATHTNIAQTPAAALLDYVDKPASNMRPKIGARFTNSKQDLHDFATTFLLQGRNEFGLR